MDFQILDIIFVIFLFIMTIFGYIKGFIVRLYDFASTLIVLFLSYFLCQPLSSLWTIYHFEETDVITGLIGKMLNQLLVFIVLFIILMIIKKLLGIVIKPVLKGFMETFKITALTDKILGVILSFLEGLVISYLCLVFVFIPFYDQKMEKLQNTLFTKYVIELVPHTAQKVSDFMTTVEMSSFDDEEALIKILLMAKEMNLINNEQFQTVFEEQILSELQNKNIHLSIEQVQELEDILQEFQYDQNKINQIKGYIQQSLSK